MDLEKEITDEQPPKTSPTPAGANFTLVSKVPGIMDPPSGTPGRFKSRPPCPIPSRAGSVWSASSPSSGTEASAHQQLSRKLNIFRAKLEDLEGQLA